MAIVVSASDLYTDPRLDQAPPDPARARGRPVNIIGTVACVVGDSAGSTYKIATVPADCVFGPGTLLKANGWGFATVQLGTKASPTALLNAAKAASMVPFAIGDARHGAPAWLALGMPAAPANNQIDLWITGPADATGAGTITFEIHYRQH